MVKKYRLEWHDKNVAWVVEGVEDQVIARGPKEKMEVLLRSLKRGGGFAGKMPDFFLAKDFL